MKKLYIRFFDSKDSVIPRDSYPVQGNSPSELTETLMSSDNADMITDWLIRYPDGRVDYTIM